MGFSFRVPFRLSLMTSFNANTNANHFVLTSSFVLFIIWKVCIYVQIQVHCFTWLNFLYIYTSWYSFLNLPVLFSRDDHDDTFVFCSHNQHTKGKLVLKRCEFCEWSSYLSCVCCFFVLIIIKFHIISFPFALHINKFQNSF